MSTEKITAYPEITKTVIEGDNVVSVIQGDYDLDKVIAHIETSIAMVRRYEKMGYYTLAKPEFVSEVITTFTDLEVKRKDVIQKLQESNIDCRPIVTGNFTKNEVMKFFDYEIHNELMNADYLHENGFFVGNSQVCLEKEITLLAEVLAEIRKVFMK